MTCNHLYELKKPILCRGKDKKVPVLSLVLKYCLFLSLKPTILDEKRRTGLTNLEMDGQKMDKRRDRWNRKKTYCKEFIINSFLVFIYPVLTWHLTIVYRPQGKGPYYPFPHLRVKLQRDPKDRSVSGKVTQFSSFH